MLNVKEIEGIVKKCKISVLTPKSFFISWNGVLTLVYSGFPSSLLLLKNELFGSIKDMPKESPGSLWPKSSLGALKDNCSLTEDQFKKLKNICESLERVSHQIDIGLLDDGLNEPVMVQSQISNVLSVLSQQNMSDYFASFVNKAGNRESHYKGEASGKTLVHFINKFPNGPPQEDKLKCTMRDFMKKVDEELPDLYSWFSLDSLHVTICGL